ncbi:MAG: type IV pilus twitching motility protein PilT [Candidatus Eisenbacteria bacterium]|uniref:Type IV pilus twitching motility protein PilT n=1 Tax=Eiseniibacteriota bacterium TaxID=2212470 RepID=A0A538SDM5_UNCEI|nr:MAG: type IV pilus twitching motility protein PilT [Candidatus Eisenbacteria bacterium]
MNIRGVLEKMIATRASDLHLKVGTPPIVRVDGVLSSLEDPAPNAQELRAVCDQLLSDEQRLYFSTHREIDFAFGVSGLGRFRANVFMQRGTPAIALRHVPVEVPTIEELKLPPVVRDLAFSPRGLVLVTGRTGSGKSTTLAAMIDAINRTTTRNVITVEDPIEFLHLDRMSIIHQREIGLDTRSFNDGLKYVLRQDPDIVLVGEIRDLETMRTALMAADTGHLILSTLHTTDVVQTIQRVISFYPPHQHEEVRLSIASNLSAVIAQRLIPRSHGQGRVPAVEVMVSTPTIQEYILDPGKTPLIENVVAEGVTQYGMQSFDQSVLGLLQAGLITEEDALRNCNHPNELALKLKGILAASDRVWQPVDSVMESQAATGADLELAEGARPAGAAGASRSGTRPGLRST